MRSFVPKAQDSLDPLKVWNLFKRITKEDVEVLGLDPEAGRPELFLWTAMPVPPVPIRPTVQKEDGEYVAFFLVVLIFCFVLSALSTCP